MHIRSIVLYFVLGISILSIGLNIYQYILLSDRPIMTPDFCAEIITDKKMECCIHSSYNCSKIKHGASNLTDKSLFDSDKRIIYCNSCMDPVLIDSCIIGEQRRIKTNRRIKNRIINSLFC